MANVSTSCECGIMNEYLRGSVGHRVTTLGWRRIGTWSLLKTPAQRLLSECHPEYLAQCIILIRYTHVFRYLLSASSLSITDLVRSAGQRTIERRTDGVPQAFPPLKSPETTTVRGSNEQTFISEFHRFISDHSLHNDVSFDEIWGSG